MATTSELLTSLQRDKINYVDKLVEKGVEASYDETFTELIPKMDEIQSGGGDISEYLDNDMPSGYVNTTVGQWYRLIKKLPPIYIPNGLDSNWNQKFLRCQSEEIIIIGNPSSLPLTMNSFFEQCGAKKIDISMVDLGNVQSVLNMFANSNDLETLIFGINLGKNYIATISNSNYTLALSSCGKLTYESLIDVINKLYDLNLSYDVANGGTLYTQKLQLGGTNKVKLTAEEIAIATNKGWTVS